MSQQQPSVRKNIWVLSPLPGILLFILLYIIAAMYYPGGSQNDKTAKGFSWIHNYWCNLLNASAINGSPNSARPIAMTGMIVLACTLGIFWWIFPQQVMFKKREQRIIQLSGVFAMVVGIFIFTGLHDMVINLAGLLGVIAVAGTLAGLYRLQWKGLFYLGIANMLLVILNNILYYGKGLIFYLPLVQKISFLCFLIWVGLISLRMYYQEESKK